MQQDLDRQVVISKSYDEFFRFTVDCIHLYNDQIPKKDLRLTDREVEVYAVLVIFYQVSQDFYSDAHMTAFEKLFGSRKTENAMLRYFRIIRDKKYIDYEKSSDSYSYFVPPMFENWIPDDRTFTLQVDLVYNNV